MQNNTASRPKCIIILSTYLQSQDIAEKEMSAGISKNDECLHDDDYGKVSGEKWKQKTWSLQYGIRT